MLAEALRGPLYAVTPSSPAHLLTKPSLASWLRASSLLVLGLLRFFVDFALLVCVHEGRQALFAFLAGVFEEGLRRRRRVRHVLTRVEGGGILLLAADELVLSFHRVGRLADLRGVVVERVVHMLHVHHVHIAASALDQWQLFNVTSLITVGIGRVAHVVPTLGRHASFLVVTHLQVWKLLLSLYWLFLSRVDMRDFALLISQIADGSEFIGVLAVLGQ